MISGFTRMAGVAALGLWAGAALAQQTTERVAASQDWSIHEASNPKECFVASQPKDSVNSRNGEVVAANRGDTPPQLTVTYRPANGVSGQIAFRGGNYQLAGGTTASIQIGGTSFQLFSEGEWAWPASPEDDARIVTAMRGGAEAIVTSQSGRGTISRDTFSLIGFTAAIEEATRRCAG